MLKLLQQSTFRQYAAKVLIITIFYFCCFRCVIMQLTGVINYVFCIYNNNTNRFLEYNHHISCVISSLLHSVNLILFTLFLVHLMLHISPHHSRRLRSHHLSLPRPFTPNFKLISFTNPFLHSLSDFSRTAFTVVEPVLN